jgi:tape measure domain-containing protein
MSDINKLSVKITGDESGLKKATKAAKKDIKSVSSTALSMGDIIKGSALGSLAANAISTVARAISQEMGGAIARVDSLKNYSNVMNGLGVSAEDSETSIALLRQELKGLPTDIVAATAAVKRLTATNGNIQASTDMFLAMNNAILAGGGTIEQQQSALEQLNQAYAKGRPEMQDWKILLQAIPAQLKQVAKTMGYASSTELYEALQSGKTSMDEFMLTMVKLNKTGGADFDSFAKQAQSASAGIQTAMTTLKYTIQNGLATIMNEIGRSNIAGAFNGIGKVIETATNYVAAFIRIIKEAVAWVGALFGGGGGSTSGIVKTTEDTADALNSAATGASNVASGLDDATDSAKKLRQQLAGFDEMNVLQEKQTADATAGTGVAGASQMVADYQWNTSSLEQAQDKIAEIAENIKKAITDIFGEWDFKKIIDAFKKFVRQVKSAMSSVGKIMSDVWNKYLSPMINWAGSSLLPAFLNALGGAIELIGKVLGAVWSNFLEPFVTNFLKPVAEFTGGVIVTVLNAIGDALSWIASQSHIIDLIAGIAVAIGAVTAATVAWTAAKGAALTVMTTMNMMTGALETQMGTLALQLGVATGNLELMAGGMTMTSTATGVAGVAVNALNGALTFLTSTAGMVAIGIGAVVAVIETVKTAFDMADFASRNYKSNQDLLTEATNAASRASRDQEEAINAVSNAQLSANNAELRLLELTKDATEKREKYKRMLDSGRYSQEDLTKAQLESEIAEGRLQTQMETLRDEVQNAIKAQDDYHDAIMREIHATKEAELRSKIMAGSYGEVYDALVELTTGTHEFTLKSGESYTLTAEEADMMSNSLLKSLERSADGFNAWVDDLKKQGIDVRAQFQAISDAAAESLGRMEPSGGAFDQGVARGILNNMYVVERAARELANAGKVAYDKALAIHSPSRVMMKSGEYFAEGIEEGIKDEEPALAKVVENVGTAMAEAFNKAPKFADLGTADLSTEFDKMTAKAQATVDLQSETTNNAIDSLAAAITRLAEQDNHITVKIGEETLIDKVVDGINSQTFMRNRNVLNL